MAEQLDNNYTSPKLEKVIKRNIALYTAGSGVSSFGTSMYNFAVGLYVLTTTGSASSFALTILFGLLPRIILSPFAGVLADKFERKKLAVSMDILSGLLMISIFLISEHSGLNLSIIYLSSALLTVFNTFFDVSISAGIPNFVDEKRFVKINSFGAMINSLSSLLGPFLGGIVYGLIGIKLFLLLNGISFICSGISEIFINFNIYNKKINEKVQSQSTLEALKDGLLYLVKHKSILGILKYLLLINFISVGLFVVLPYMIVEVLNASPEQFGLIEMGIPIGALVMSIIISNKKTSDGKIFKILFRCMFLAGVVFILFGIPTSPLAINNPLIINLSIIFILSTVLGAMIVSINIPLSVMMQKTIDDEYRGRVNSVSTVLTQLMTPISLVLFGILSDNIPSYLIPMICGISIILVSFLMFADKKMQKI